jgi:hypothetical protein
LDDIVAAELEEVTRVDACVEAESGSLFDRGIGVEPALSTVGSSNDLRFAAFLSEAPFPSLRPLSLSTRTLPLSTSRKLPLVEEAGAASVSRYSERNDLVELSCLLNLCGVCGAYFWKLARLFNPRSDFPDPTLVRVRSEVSSCNTPRLCFLCRVFVDVDVVEKTSGAGVLARFVALINGNDREFLSLLELIDEEGAGRGVSGLVGGVARRFCKSVGAGGESESESFV